MQTKIKYLTLIKIKIRDITQTNYKIPPPEKSLLKAPFFYIKLH